MSIQASSPSSNIRRFASRVRRGIRHQLGQPVPSEIMDRHEIAAADAPSLAQQIPGEIAKVFFQNHGRIVHKWVHYLEIYERHFAQFRNTSVAMLEIGVYRGGSLQMWREYFGGKATIFGIDIDPSCTNYVSPPNQVRIGSQDDPAFLQSVISEMRAPDIVLDDGSHIARHQHASFDNLFPMLKDGGLYIIEDIHSAYWPGWHGGGYRKRGTAVEHVKTMIDDLHA